MTIPLMAAKYHRQTLALVTFAGVVFRSELAVLVVTFSGYIFHTTGHYSLTRTIIPAGAVGLILGLLATVPIDSFFWQKFPLWPEWTSFYFNTILGNSSNWGVSPWHFYFTNALPRLLLNPLSYTLLIPLALLTPSNRQRSIAIVAPLLAFVALYSALPHKEWRFILYIIPGLNAASALGATWIWNRRTKSLVYGFFSYLLIISTIFSFAVSLVILSISRLNYPGGDAITQLRALTASETGTINVYADNLACQTGLTRFLESRHSTSPRYIFDKTENTTLLHIPQFWDKFDYVITENLETTIGKFEVVKSVYGWNGLRIVRPGEEVMQREMLQGLYITGDKGGNLMLTYEALERWMRDTVTRGWWVTFRIEPRLRILKHQRTGAEMQTDRVEEVMEQVVG
jgi:alpha-1,6-mannosyltransferase